MSRTWEIEVFWRRNDEDPRARELRTALTDWTGVEASIAVSDLYYVSLSDEAGAVVEASIPKLFSDPVTQSARVRDLGSDAVATATRGSEALADFPAAQAGQGAQIATVLKRPGVMDSVQASIQQGIEDLGCAESRARTGKRVVVAGELTDEQRETFAQKVLSNQAIENVFWNDQALPAPFPAAAAYEFKLGHEPITTLDDAQLLDLSSRMSMALDLDEMKTIQAHYVARGNEPTDAELETIAQTWSEHCCHKTLTSAIRHVVDGQEFNYKNLLKDTIVRATETIQAEETTPFCLSLFKDNAGVVAFDDEYGISFKVETHNHPSAIEPYGGAGTGIGGVLRDTLGTGLGAKPIINTDVFCFGLPDMAKEDLPKGVQHPLRVLKGVVGGVRDYGNRMGIPTASGGLYFDERYTTNPLVYCGSVGLIPRDAIEKEVFPGDRIVVMGGRTGRDGIHGATFSSEKMDGDSETESRDSVQIGNPITEKTVLDVLLQARDERLYTAVTDCGAGGLSSAVGEMGEETGARVDLDKVPLKYAGLSYSEIWISEAQERMVFSVPADKIDRLFELSASEGVECTDIGEFTDTGRLELFYDGTLVADIDMKFLFDGRPQNTRESCFTSPASTPVELTSAPEPGALLKAILAAPNVASKEWVIRQYDHEVQGRSVLKPFQGPGEGPGDGVAFTPRLDSLKGVVLGLGMNPRYGDLDPYRMALSAIDESIRNIVSAGGDPDRSAILDNFCWGNTKRPETLGTIVEAARGCHDGAVALGAPFVSGKDSLNNEFDDLSIPPSLLISSVAMVDDVRRLVSMDLKAPGNLLVLVGETQAELGGSHLAAELGETGGLVPDLPSQARDIHRGVYRAIQSGCIASCHDLSEGGLGVAAAEMAFAGGVGAEIRLADVLRGDDVSDDLTVLFSESNSRYLIEVEPSQLAKLQEQLGAAVPSATIGTTVDYHILRVLGLDGEALLAEALDDLRDVWKNALVF